MTLTGDHIGETVTYASTHYYLTWGGRIGTPAQDVWQCGVRISDLDNSDAQYDMPNLAQLELLYEGALTTFHSAAATGISSGAVLEWVKVARIDPLGHYTQEPVIFEGDPVPGGVGGINASSPQDALVITLASGNTFGDANYGRFYLPWSALAVSTSTGKMVVTNVLTQAQTFLNSLNAQVLNWNPLDNGDYQVVIMSEKGAGTTKPVRQVRVGDVKDTQRRRRNKLVETYISANVTQPIGP